MPTPPYSPLGRQSACVLVAYRHIDPIGTPFIYGINEATASDIVVGVNTSVMHGGSMNLPDPGTVPASRRVWFKDESDNAGTYGFSITTAAGTIEGDVDIDTNGKCIGYYSNGVDTWFQIDAVGAGGGGATITGSATQIAVCDGSGNAAGSANCTFNTTGFIFSVGDIGASANRTRMVMNDSTQLAVLNTSGVCAFGDWDQMVGGMWFQVDNATGRLISWGDLGGMNNGTNCTLDDAAQAFSANCGGAVFVVNGANAKLTSSADFYFDTDAIGPILIDRTTATNYRLFVDNGVLDIEAV